MVPDTKARWEIAEARLAVIEAECERLRAELDKAGYDAWMRTAKELGAEKDALQARLASVEAELARSQAEHKGWAARAYAIAAERNAALDRLEAAEGLLSRVQRWRPPSDQPPHTYDAFQRQNLKLTEDIEAFEAEVAPSAQPAAPARADVDADERIVVDLQIATEAELRAELARRAAAQT